MDRKEIEERIALGECMSPLTTERCPYCVDSCRAFETKCRYRELLKDSGIKD